MDLRNANDTADRIDRDALTWKPLRLFTFYRLTLAGLLTILFFGIPDNTALGTHDPKFYTLTCMFYIVFSVAAGFAARLRRPGYELQTVVQILVDIGVITLLIYASGGPAGGLGILLIITVAAGSLLIPGRMAFLFAAMATMAIMGEHAYSTLLIQLSRSSDYTQVGLLGIALFVTAGMAFLMARRIHESEALARQRGIDVANLARLNDHIVQRLQAGIIVTDSQHNIRLSNKAAHELLGLPADCNNRPLAEISPQLHEKLMDWRQAPDQEASLLVSESTGASILPQFTLLGTADGIGALIFLEDTTAMAQQAQQIKLASLGRLTASIAHEIRNPLGAISHATQLLKESSELGSEDQRLMTIIRNHTRRVNTVVEDVLQLSRPVSTLPQVIVLHDWLGHFTDEFVHSGNCKPDQVEVAVNPQDLSIYMDTSQLHQVVWNLCQNAIRHGNREGKAVKIQLVGGRSGRNRAPHLDIIDNGPGIDPAMTSEIFEPFFTTNSSGTGLGLYIAREICESNQARLTYQPHDGDGSCFRISFPDTAGLVVKALA